MKYHVGLEAKYRFPKFDYQINALKSMGFNVYYLGFKDNNVYLCHNTDKEFLIKFNKSKLSKLSIILLYNALYKATSLVFSKTIKFQYAYIRAMPIMPSYNQALKIIKEANCKIIVEIPTYPIEKEIKTEKRLVRRVYFQLSNYYFKRSSGLVDLFALIGEHSDLFAGRPAINIENGISLESIPLRNEIPRTNNEIHLLGLANMAKWHGYDRVIEGLKDYYHSGGTVNIIFHLIGTDADGSLKEWQLLTENYDLQKHVVFEGPKFNSELNYYFNKCQVAIGSIGLHRIGYKSAATLKIREYTARGIPYILSASDLALNNCSNYYLEVPENDNALDIIKIIDFINKHKSSKLRKSMRKFAEENMTWNKQFEKIISKMNVLQKDKKDVTDGNK